MSLRRITPILVFLLSISTSLAKGPPTPAQTGSKLARLEAPAGTIIPLELKNLVSSHMAYPGEAMYCETIYPVVVNDRILIPAGSYVKGEVTDVVRPGRIKGKASMSIRFTSITLPNGFTQPLSASVYSIAGSRLGEPKTETDPDDQQASQDLAVGGAQDAVIDATGLGSGSFINAASQGVGGLVLLLATRGKNIIMRSGTNLEIRLASPLPLERHPAPLALQQKKATNTKNP